jgi:peptidoglycan/LPS O-acetylase OafA/YrhL
VIDHFWFFMYGRYAVDLFIVISGYCLMLPVIKSGGELRRGPLDFLKRRAWRILPPYYLAMAVSLLFIWLFIGKPTGTHWDVTLPVTWHAVLSHLVLLHDACGDDFKINHVFWSIAVEWRLYFFFPFLVLAWRYWGALTTTILAIVASRVLQHYTNIFIGTSLTFNYLGLFACGMLGAAITYPSSNFLRRAQELPWSWITLGLTLFVLVDPILTDYAVGFWSASFIVMTSIHRGAWHHKLLSFPPLVFIGTYAYSIYLIHAPFLQILWQYLFAPLQSDPLAMFLTLLFAGIPLILAFSYLFFLLCERPFLNRRKPVVVVPGATAVG